MSDLMEAGVNAPGEALPEPTAAAEVTESSWSYAENVPGSGDRPEWLKEKYSDVQSQAKAYTELEKRLGGSNAPESYDLSDFGEYLDSENEHIVKLTANAKEHRLSQDALKEILAPMKEYHNSLLPDTDAEIAKLGEHANAKIKTLDNWASNNLSEEAIATLGKVSTTADVINMMDEIRQLHYQANSNVPATMDTQPKSIESYESIQQEIINNYPQYKTDANFRAKMQAKLNQVAGE